MTKYIEDKPIIRFIIYAIILVFFAIIENITIMIAMSTLCILCELTFNHKLNKLNN